MKKILFCFILLFQCFYSIAQQDKRYPSAHYYPSADSMLECLNNFPYKQGDVYNRLDVWDFSVQKNVTDTIRRKLLTMIKPFEWTDSMVKKKVDEYLTDHPFLREFEWRFWDLDLKDSIIDLARRRG